MKILIMTRSEWSDANSTGNTMSNFFGGIQEKKLANIYVRESLPNNQVCSLYYSISDKELLKSIFLPNYKAGKSFKYTRDKNKENNKKESNKIEKNIYSYFRHKNSKIALLSQNFLWNIGNWKNKNLDSFIKEFQPDIIFSPSFHTIYTHKVLSYIKNKSGAPLVIFHADDYFNDNDVNTFLDRIYFNKRKKVITKSIDLASLNYCISKKQQEEYSEMFNKQMKILNKGANFNKQPRYVLNNKNIIKLVYIGSVHHGRWRTLSELAKNIEEVNKKSSIEFQLDIYSQYELDKTIKKQIEIKNISKFHGKIPSEKVIEIMKNSDIVLHIESFEEKEKNQTRLSFSTKIVDCMKSSRTIFAIGDKDAASIDYLKQNDAALIANNNTEITKKLNEIQDDKTILKEYSEKSWELGKKNHQLEIIRANFYKDLETLMKEEELYESTTN